MIDSKIVQKIQKILCKVRNTKYIDICYTTDGKVITNKKREKRYIFNENGTFFNF